MKAALIQWLEDPNKDYEVGVAIYSKFGKKDWLKDFFSKGKSLTSMEKLVSCVREIADSIPEEKFVPEISSRAVSGEWSRIATPKSQPVDPQHLTPRLKGLYQIQKKMFSEMSHTHSGMIQLSEGKNYNAQRMRMAKRIEELAEMVDWIWLEMDSYLKTGRELPLEQQLNTQIAMKVQLGQHAKAIDVDIDSLSTAQLFKKEKSLMASISRHKKKNDTSAVLEKQAILQEIRKRISNV